MFQSRNVRRAHVARQLVLKLWIGEECQQIPPHDLVRGFAEHFLRARAAGNYITMDVGGKDGEVLDRL